METYGIPVMFDVTAQTRQMAAQVVATRLSVYPRQYPEIQSWWLIEAEDKAVDNNDNRAGVVVWNDDPIPLTTEREPVLLEAHRIITGDRRADYGDAYDSFNKIAVLWSEVLGITISAEQVALCMIELKIARYLNGAQRDSAVDIAGYAGLLDVIAGRRNREGGLR